jgi:hypothetical protein
VLVVVEDRDVELLAQPCLNLEAARRGDVLEVDAGEAGRDGPNHRDDLIHVLGVETERLGIDVAEPLEQRRLPSITGNAASGPMLPRPSTT